MCCLFTGAQAFLQLWQAGATLMSMSRHCRGFSCCRAPAQGHTGFSSCSCRALGHRLNSCGARAQLFCGVWDLPGSGLCLLNWQADSLPLSHQGSSVFKTFCYEIILHLQKSCKVDTEFLYALYPVYPKYKCLIYYYCQVKSTIQKLRTHHMVC